MANLVKNNIRCAVYTRKSSEDGLDQNFNSLEAQRDACSSFIQSQKHEGWEALPDNYDDGGFSGGTLERPSLKRLFKDVQERKLDIIVVYKIDRLTRSLTDFAKMVELFEQYNVTFISITQQFNTTTSMGRLTLNVLLSFAQFEREITGERIRDKIAASKAKGLWMGGHVPLGYEIVDRRLQINKNEAGIILKIYLRYLELKSVQRLHQELALENMLIPCRYTKSGKSKGSRKFDLHNLYKILKSPIYSGKIKHKDKIYQGEHDAIIGNDLWNSVQSLLHENRMTFEHSLNAQSPSRLAGKIFDENGEYLSPTHGNKNKRRYRYYINQRLKISDLHDMKTVRRLPAQEIDDFVEREFLKLLEPSNVQSLFAEHCLDDQAQIIENANGWNKYWEGVDLYEKNVILRSCLIKLVVATKWVEIYWDKNVILSLLLDPGISGHSLSLISQNMGDIIKIKVSAQLIEIRKRKRLIVGDLDNFTEASASLVRDVCQAYKWNQSLLSRRFKTMKELAESEDKDLTYVSAMLRFAWLAPDIIEKILDGNEPKSMNVRSIRKINTFNWVKQREILDM